MTMCKIEGLCPTCEGTAWNDAGTDYCEACDGSGQNYVHIGEHCDNCGRRASWGCGCTPEMEAEAREHMESPEHLSGACEHFGHALCDPEECERAGQSVKGYAAFVQHGDAEAYFAKQKV